MRAEMEGHADELSGEERRGEADELSGEERRGRGVVVALVVGRRDKLKG